MLNQEQRRADLPPLEKRNPESSFSKLSHQMVVISRLHYRMTYTKLAEQSIPLGAPPLLRWISCNEGCRHKDLAENCHLEPATVTSALLTMEKEKLIRRESDPSDRRSIRIWLTDRGKEALSTAFRVFEDIESCCFKDFSPQEKKQAEVLLQRILSNMLADGGESFPNGQSKR